MHDDGLSATAMLGASGRVLFALSEDDGEFGYAIEASETVNGCREYWGPGRPTANGPTGSDRSVTLVWR